MAEEPQEKLVELVAVRVDAYKSDLACSISKELQASVVAASEYATKQLDKKRTKHAATIRAFIRRNGNHATRLCPKEVWNENFSKLFNDLVVKQESTVVQLRETLTKMLEDGIKQDLREFVKKLDTFPGSVPKQRLAEAIDIQVRGIENAFELARADNLKDVRNILLDVTQDSFSNYLSRTMRPVYDACRDDSGNGVTKRSLARLEEHLSKTGKNSSFAYVERKVSAALLQTDSKYVTERIQNEVARILQQVYESVENLVDDTIIDETEVAAREAMESVLPSLQEEWEVVHEELAELKKKYEN